MTFKNPSSMVCFALAGLLVLSCGGQPDRGGDGSTDDPVGCKNPADAVIPAAGARPGRSP